MSWAQGIYQSAERNAVCYDESRNSRDVQWGPAWSCERGDTRGRLYSWIGRCAAAGSTAASPFHAACRSLLVYSRYSTRPTSCGVTQYTPCLSTGGGWKGDVAQLISDSRIERSRRARLVNPDMMRPQ